MYYAISYPYVTGAVSANSGNTIYDVTIYDVAMFSTRADRDEWVAAGEDFQSSGGYRQTATSRDTVIRRFHRGAKSQGVPSYMLSLGHDIDAQLGITSTVEG